MRRVTKPKATEYEEQVAFIEWADLYCASRGIPPFIHIPNGDLRPKKARVTKDGRLVHYSPVAQRLQRMGARRGVPDLFLPYPHNGKAGLWIEVKSESGRPTEEQLEWISKLNAAGYEARICYGIEEMIHATTEYVEGKKET